MLVEELHGMQLLYQQSRVLVVRLEYQGRLHYLISYQILLLLKLNRHVGHAMFYVLLMLQHRRMELDFDEPL